MTGKLALLQVPIGWGVGGGEGVRMQMFQSKQTDIDSVNPHGMGQRGRESHGVTVVAKLLLGDGGEQPAASIKQTPNRSTLLQQRLPCGRGMWKKWHVNCQTSGWSLKSTIKMMYWPLKGQTVGEGPWACCFQTPWLCVLCRFSLFFKINFQGFPTLLYLQMEGVDMSHPSFSCLWSGPQSSMDSAPSVDLIMFFSSLYSL